MWTDLCPETHISPTRLLSAKTFLPYYISHFVWYHITSASTAEWLSILVWLYGQGLSKQNNKDKSMDTISEERIYQHKIKSCFVFYHFIAKWLRIVLDPFVSFVFILYSSLLESREEFYILQGLQSSKMSQFLPSTNLPLILDHICILEMLSNVTTILLLDFKYYILWWYFNI